MVLDGVIQAILDDGRKEATLIIEEGIREKERLISEANMESDKLIEERKKDVHISTERLKTKELARADIEAKRILLRAQKEIIDNVHVLALKRLSERSFVETIIKLKSGELKDSFVYCNEKEKETVMKVIVPFGARFGGTIDCAGGLIIESLDRKIICDYRLESILERVWDDSITKIVTLLWR